MRVLYSILLYCFSYSNQDSNCLEYHWFDFHAECKGMHFENVRKLLDETSQSVREGSFFHYNLSIGCILEIQNSVLRTNCIDCLDRNNESSF